MSRKGLPRARPESLGLDSRVLLDFLRQADSRFDGLHGLALVRRGAVATETAWKPYRASDRHTLFSLSKSFLSCAVGLAISEGRLSPEERVLSFFPEASPPSPSANLRAMRVRHLLTMTTGHEADTTRLALPHPDPLRAFLALPVEREPGTHFVYNSGASFVLSAIVQRLTGKRVLDYLRPRFLEPIGIEGAEWESHSCGIDFGGFGLSATTEDIARLGILLLGRGRWEGSRVLDEAWVDEATGFRVPNGNAAVSDWCQGYGYQFWRCRHGAYRGDGAFGQFCVVLPEQEAVLAITSGLPDMQAVLNLVWDGLLPAFHEGELPADPGAAAELEAFAASRELRPVTGAVGAGAADLAAAAAWEFGDNELDIARIGFRREVDRDVISYALRGMPEARGEIACGRGAWIEGESALGASAGLAGPPPAGRKARIAASGAWVTEREYAAKLWFLGTPYAALIRLEFEEGKARFSLSYNVGFGKLEYPAIDGRPLGAWGVA
ncbi:MAG: serine hydrolase [Spirochaetaceae bacterium]|nr:serine hydrolase [Spirochaetaceae bacterium]